MSGLRLGGVLVCLLGSSCEPSLLVGELQCSPSEAGAPSKTASGAFNEGPLPAPWQTSFDDGFCGYKYRAGFCYSDPDSSYRLVTEPVHTGPFAAAFDMNPSEATGARQVRCVREGVLPSEAYYGAWYYVPSDLSAAAHSWNLFHFQGGVSGQRLDGLWDVSMDDSSGVLAAYVANLMGGEPHARATPKPIPINRWFHLEFYLKSAPDTTGEVALYQDGEELLRVTGVITNDTPFTQWYVGNWTGTIAPNSPTYSLYVDDVSVRLP
jgi:Polysaccharide lyase